MDIPKDKITRPTLSSVTGVAVWGVECAMTRVGLLPKTIPRGDDAFIFLAASHWTRRSFRFTTQMIALAMTHNYPLTKNKKPLRFPNEAVFYFK